jgi:peptide/nickel transport system ATP-binding protein
MFARPLHPYTQALIDSLPILGNRGVFRGIPGIPPSVINPAPGCPFSPRCPKSMEICNVQAPPLIQLEPGRWVSCHLYD